MLVRRLGGGLWSGVADRLEVLLEEVVEGLAFPREEVAIRTVWTLRPVVNLSDPSPVWRQATR